MSNPTLIDEAVRRTNLAFANQMEMLTFFLSDQQQYGINVFKIIEVIETPATITKIPRAHPAMIGSINFRERVVTVIDLSAGLGMTPTDRHAISYIIICEYSNSIQGLLISNPNKLINKGWDEIKKPGNSWQSGYLTALTYDDDGNAIQILDVEKILGEIVGIDDDVSQDILDTLVLGDLESLRILVVDDSRAARSLMEHALNQIGVSHVLAEDAVRGLHLLEENIATPTAQPFSLIISDIEMPGMDGFTFARTVKSDTRLAHIPLALHSSMSNQSNRVKARQMGADHFIAKFQPNEIARWVLSHAAHQPEAVA